MQIRLVATGNKTLYNRKKNYNKYNMRHFISYFNDSVKKHWDLPAVTNFGKETYTYAQMAEEIEKYHILFEKAGIKKGDKIALYARNSAEWCIAYYATLTYDAVTVPCLSRVKRYYP